MFKLPVASPKISPKAKEYVNDCLEKGWLSWRGEYVERFEEAFAKYTKARHAVMVTNGTAAIHVACLAANVNNPVVAVPNYTFVATGTAPLLIPDAKIKLIDIEPYAWSMDINYIEKGRASINQAFNIIIPVAISGYPWAVDTLNMAYVAKHAIIIADMAQGLGLKFTRPRNSYAHYTRGEEKDPVGITQFCHMATYSFFANKSLPIGEGGMITTDSTGYYELLKHYRTLPTFGDEYRYKKITNNYRPTNIQAAIGLAQLELVDEIVEAKRVLSEKYRQAINWRQGISCQKNIVTDAISPDWMFRISFTSSDLSHRVMEDLHSIGVEIKPLYKPLNRQTVFQTDAEIGRVLNYGEYLPISESLRGFYLPTHQDVTDRNVEEITQVINKHVSGV